MPRSRLEGREPVEVTEHEYDDAGRLVRSVTTREPEWTEDDFAELLALAEYRAGLCPCCGLPADKTQAQEGSYGFVVSKKFCHARRTLAETQAAYFKNRPESPAHQALLWSVRVEKG